MKLRTRHAWKGLPLMSEHGTVSAICAVCGERVIAHTGVIPCYASPELRANVFDAAVAFMERQPCYPHPFVRWAARWIPDAKYGLAVALRRLPGWRLRLVNTEDE